MYEPIRTKSVHSMAPPRPAAAVRSDYLSEQLAGHLAALLAVTDRLRAAEPSAVLDAAAAEIAERIAQLSPGSAPVRIWEGSRLDGPDTGALHRQAHTLAGRVLVVAAARQDTATAMLACRRMDAHAAALGLTAVPA